MDTRRENDRVKTEPETGGVYLQVKGGQPPLEAGEKDGADSPSEPPEGTSPKLGPLVS